MKVVRNMITLATGFAVVLADQYTKTLIRKHLPFGETRTVIPGFFNLAHSRNTGAVWGILQQHNAWLILFSLIVLFLIVVFYRKIIVGRLSCSIATGLMLGGITGNLVDRIKFGWVTDFLDFHLASAHWPCFNIADAAICAGVALYMLSSLLLPADAPAREFEENNSK